MNVTIICVYKKAALIPVLAFFLVAASWSQTLIPVQGANSPYDEIHPVLAPSGDLYFTRAFHPENPGGPENPGDIWLSHRLTTGVYDTAKRVKELSTEGFDLVIGFPDANQVYVYHSAQAKHPSAGIYSYRYKEGSWQAGANVEIPGFRPIGARVSGRLSQDGDAIVLSMNSFGSYGNEDIYISLKDESGSWSRLIHLGPEINTPFQELTPFLSADQTLLFFSSNGQGSQSSQRIFFSRRLDDTFARWSSPLPLPMREGRGMTLSYFTDGLHAKSFMTSTSSSDGYGDIFLLESALDVPILEDWPELSSQREPQTERALSPVPIIPSVASVTEPADVSERKIPDLVTDKAVSVPNRGQTRKDRLLDRFAVFSITSLRGDSLLVLTDESPVDLFDTDLAQATLQVPGYLPIRLTAGDLDGDLVGLVPARSEARMLLENIQFQRGSTQFLDSRSEAEVQVIAVFLQRNATLKIVLEGHTDSFGNVELNKKLSLDRAHAVRDRLVADGIEPDRIRVVGYGGTRPIADNQREEGRMQNRRVEMVILEE
ncbi:outer membrane protein, OmpA/OmpF family [Lunatimonas lonarensis]|uniref:Outer membrane protein, OmpA/OmpF family n=1 Tax=Lunatimonas lonarensis TaxID=1232681 RepID=R7ZVH5_9BACT|nr:OmpA family protein [Lunatimonas lonarensis]EON78130.1 outer membrane protein, OmpA/OmpF family [Lunatimonas lonarensis]